MLQHSQHHWFRLSCFVESSAHSFDGRIVCVCLCVWASVPVIA
ncbi:hypothetical protein E2C01_054769 [Portunus trituberculatus]|uniref:Uncharacterized protein n=1 Tax=Portunus trituberculatus TaxID=210409 RepID=A0A5B7GSY0_PORTR|nr:hypothetical protein [Portunus trituberculatus]